MNYGVGEVQQAIDGITSRLGCGPSRTLQIKYEEGLHPDLLAYDKIDTSAVSLVALTRCLVGAASFVNQPTNYFNIFGACRSANIVQFLERAVRHLTSRHIEGVHTRLERLISEHKRDAFEAIAFELITAARYLEHPLVTSVKFIQETSSSKTPDFVVLIGELEIYVECKKIDRTQDFTLKVRNAARALIDPVLKSFQEKSTSLLADVTFHADPQELSSHKLAKTFQAALRKQVPIIDHDYTVIAKHLPRYTSEDVVLCPSPALWWDRYRYKTLLGIASGFRVW